MEETWVLGKTPQPLDSSYVRNRYSSIFLKLFCFGISLLKLLCLITNQCTGAQYNCGV